MLKGIFASFTFNDRSLSRYALRFHMYDYLGLFNIIRGFSHFHLEWSRPFLWSFARYADKYISDYFGTI